MFKSEEQRSVLNNIKMFYEAWEKAIKLFDDYSEILCKVKHASSHGNGLK